ncbi:NAD-dependent deacylase [Robiginitomaculum antarcticum]|uniref:NAD-dependent deacylase n=1 Tax=Robiginitomaculum antarcticum TaxID=437507 RepID=UPI00036FAA80|nr:NAD-dependent deacylase [Robiginitomaculum antarcticum]
MSKNIVILSGAGISAESGIKTFRDAGGLWEDHPVEQVATPEGFAADPVLVQRFYNLRRAALKTVTPNAAHIALARLQSEIRARGGDVMIVTQNVDDLHERGGAKYVLHMHGELKRVFCTACDFHADWDGDVSVDTPCLACRTVGTVRPDIVWFGEIPHHMDAIDRALSQCDLFVSIGTSGAVYPAAGFVRVAKHYGAQTLELNLEPSEGNLYFDETRLGKAGNTVPAWVENILAG